MTAIDLTEPAAGAGQIELGAIRCATQLIDQRCTCSWVVIHRGPGLACVSAVKYLSLLCPVSHRETGHTRPAAWRGG